MRDLGRGVGGVLVERLRAQQRVGQRLELAAVLVEQPRDLAVGLLDDPPHLLVDEALGQLGRLAGAGQQRALLLRGSTAIGPIASLIPQRPTMPRAIWVSCWMSDSAPVVIVPNTTSSATRPPSATLILASSQLSS